MILTATSPERRKWDRMRDEAAARLKTCATCGKSFDPLNPGRPNDPPRKTCSRSCAVSLSWKTNTEKRRRSITAARSTPEARARQVERNNERWAQPGEREKLAERSRKMWAKPRTRAKLSKAIKQAQNDPSRRAQASVVRTILWRDDEYRAKVIEGVRRSHTTPEARAKFSRLLTERWNDPAIRARMSAGIKIDKNRPEVKAHSSTYMRERWATDENYRATVLEAMRIYQASPEACEIKSARMKALWADPVWKMQQAGLIADGLILSDDPRAAQLRKGLSALASATDFMAAVDNVVPRGLPDFIRSDVCQDIMVALLEGSLKLKNLKEGAKVHLREYNKMFPDKFGPVSLDAPIPGMDGLKMLDLIADDTPHF